MLHIFKADTSTTFTLPTFSNSVQADFPSPAEDYLEKTLDLNALLISHPAATFFVRVMGESISLLLMENLQ